MQSDDAGISKVGAIHRAARRGECRVILELLYDGSDISEVDSNGEQALHIGAKHCHVGVVSVLVHMNANLDVVNREGNTALHLAIMQKCLPICRILIERGCDVNLRNQKSDSPLQLVCASKWGPMLHLLVQHGAEPELLVKDAARAWLRSMEGVAPKNPAPSLLQALVSYWKGDICHALQSGKLGRVVELLETGLDVNMKLEFGDSPLIIAAALSQVEIASVLLHYGANVHHQNQINNTALHVASYAGCLPLVDILLKTGANINQINSEKDTPLLLACMNMQVSVVALLMERGANLRLKSKEGKSPLRLARNAQNRELLSALYRKNKSKSTQSAAEAEEDRKMQEEEEEMLPEDMANLEEGTPPVEINLSSMPASKPQSSVSTSPIRSLLRQVQSVASSITISPGMLLQSLLGGIGFVCLWQYADEKQGASLRRLGESGF